MSKQDENNKTLSKQLVKYSMAASSTLLLCSQAAATPQYSGLKNETFSQSMFQVDIDGNSVIDFDIIDSFNPNNSNQGIIAINANGSNFNNLIKGQSVSSGNVPPRFSVGQQIGPANSFAAGKYLAFNGFSSLTGGEFLGQRGFLGVRFKIGDNEHYGWIHFEGGNPPTYGKVIDWGYEDQPNTAILAGAPKYKKTTAKVPTLNEWGILILMALILEEGLRRMKRKKEQVPQLS